MDTHTPRSLLCGEKGRSWREIQNSGKNVTESALKSHFVHKAFMKLFLFI